MFQTGRCIPANPVHPHASGEHRPVRAVAVVQHGSSPREWGTYFLASYTSILQRFIPTRVGNIIHSYFSVRLFPVHPHASGEHLSFLSDSTSTSGSSPREWGTYFIHEKCNNAVRFIPTRVGNMDYITLRLDWIPVHPHASGEHENKENEKCLIIGSSPREWGTSPLNQRLQVLRWFIPTRVGNITINDICGMELAVHPHASGEHPTWMIIQAGAFGSSPREWGT